LRWGSRGKAGCKGRSRRGKGFQVEERRSVREQRSGEERRGEELLTAVTKIFLILGDFCLELS